jgi:hypothetical protein
MKDNKGLYYYPNANNKKIRMYVQRQNQQVFFRLWSQDDPKLYDQHGWVPYEAILAAADLYEGKAFDPKSAYDIDLAEALLKEENK